MTQPNILFIFADQLRYSALACNGNRIVRTPSFDQLAREGVAFDHAYASCPICSPYRGQLLTGRYSHVNGVVCNEYRLFEGQTTIAHRLKDHGYRTAYVGKWHLGYGPFDPPSRHGFDEMFSYNNGHSYYSIRYWHNESGPFPMVDYAPRVETQLALDWIDRHREKKPEKPFCLFLSWGPPHWNSIGGRDYGEYPQEFNIYDPGSVDVPPNVPRHFHDFAAREIADYYGMVTSLDECMGKILDALDWWGLAENTIVCFSSDHGDHLSSHGYGKPGEWMATPLTASKATPYEESIHIPFLLRYPEKVEGNRRTRTFFSSVDVLPTLFGLCDLSIPEDIQGKNLSHAAMGIEGEEPDSVYLQILGPGWPTRSQWVGLWRGVRTPDFTYARWFDRGGMRILFDRRNDRWEMKNCISDPAYAETAGQLEERLKRWLQETADPFDTGERLPGTNMLDLGQAFSSEGGYEAAPKEYAAALKARRSS